MPDFRFSDFLIIGSISTEFIIDLNNRPQSNLIGGSALYAAGGLRCWKDRVAIVSQTHSRYKGDIEKLSCRYQIDCEGVQFHPDYIDDRNFIGYVSPYEVVRENPVAFYASRNIVFPKNLIGFSKVEPDSPTTRNLKILPANIPAHYWDITGALICHADINAQLQVSSMLQKTSAKVLVVQSSDQYMKMANFDAMPILMKDVTTFVTTMDQLSNLFHNRSRDIWEMVDYLCSLGCESVVIEDGHFGCYLFDNQLKKRFHVPIYPVKMVDPTGMMESFCGGFLAGIKNNFDPLEALLYGIVSASFTAEGSGPFFAADAFPALLQSRLNYSKELVKTL